MSQTQAITKQKPACFRELRNPYRYKLCCGGRGRGASWEIADDLLELGMRYKLLILCTRELQKSIAGSVYKLLKNTIERNGYGYHYPEELSTKTSIRGINGTEFIFMGIRYNASDIKSTEGIDICWIEEAEALTEEGFNVITPTVRKDSWDDQKKLGIEDPTGLPHGSEIWMSFNFRYKYDFVNQYFIENKPPPSTLIVRSTYEDNPFFPEVLRQEMEHDKATDWEKYSHVWLGKIKQVAKGAVFGPQIEAIERSNRRLFIPVEPSVEVWTYNDLGKNDPTAWWFYQNVAGQHRFIDYYESRFEGVAHYNKVISAMKAWYNMTKHIMPHDAKHDRLGMEGTLQEQFESGGVRPVEVVPRVQDKNLGIALAREWLGKLWFHEGNDEDREDEACEGFIPWLADGWRTRTQRMNHGWDRLCHYRYKFNEVDQTFSRVPHHDIASNAADALMQFAQSYEPERDAFMDQELPDGPDRV